MKKNILCLILFLSLIISMACKNSDSPTAATDDQPSITNQTYTNPNIGLSVSFPEDWTLQMNVPVNGYDALLVAEKNIQVNIPPSVIILNEKMDSKPPMDALLSGVEDALPDMLENVEIIEKSIIEINGYECGEITYTFTDGENQIKQQQLYIFHKMFVIMMNFTTDKENFSSYQSDFSKIRNSVELRVE
jgi:hypothetical protein